MASITWTESEDSKGNFYSVGEFGDANKRSFTIEHRPEMDFMNGDYGLFFNGEFIIGSEGDEEWARSAQMQSLAERCLKGWG